MDVTEPSWRVVPAIPMAENSLPDVSTPAGARRTRMHGAGAGRESGWTALTRFEKRLQPKACDASTEGRAKKGRRCKRSKEVRILARKGKRGEELKPRAEKVCHVACVDFRP